MAAILLTEWNDREVEKLVDEAIANKTTRQRLKRYRLGSYNGHSGELRDIGDWKIRVAKELNLIPPPKTCSVCGQSEGTIDYHAEDYSRPLIVVPICKGCHVSLHRRNGSPGWVENWRRRVTQFGNGTKWFEFVD